MVKHSSSFTWFSGEVEYWRMVFRAKQRKAQQEHTHNTKHGGQMYVYYWNIWYKQISDIWLITLSQHEHGRIHADFIGFLFSLLLCVSVAAALAVPSPLSLFSSFSIVQRRESERKWEPKICFHRMFFGCLRCISFRTAKCSQYSIFRSLCCLFLVL